MLFTVAGYYIYMEMEENCFYIKEVAEFINQVEELKCQLTNIKTKEKPKACRGP